MRSEPVAVVGREAELAAVDTLLDTASRELSVLRVEGEPGIGKTTLWRAALQRAAARGFSVLSTGPTQAEASLSFAGLTDLFGGAPGGAVASLPEPQREAFSAAVLQSAAPPGGIDERALFAAVLSLIRTLSQESTLLLAVDDAQWLDIPTARALTFAVRRLQLEPVAVLTAVRVRSAGSATFETGVESGRRVTLGLGPLSLASLHDVIKEQLALSLPRPVMVRLAQACGGNPLYALAMAAELDQGAPDAGRMPLPSSLTDLLTNRMRRLPPETRRALVSSALLSRPTVDIVDRAALAPAERAGIVSVDRERVLFNHPLFASAIQQQTDSAEQRRVHRRLAGLLSEPEERARHAALGADTPDAAIAGELQAAAESARWRGAPVSAAELLELAANLTPHADGQEAAARRIAAASAWFHAGDLSRAQRLLESALAGEVEPSLRARALHTLGQLHARRSSYGSALQTGVQAVQAAAGDAALTAEVEMDVAYYFCSVGDLSSAVTHIDAGRAAAERASDSALLADVLAVSTMVEFIAGIGFDEARIQQARRLEDPRRQRAWQMTPAYVHGSLLLYLGRTSEALQVLGALHTESVERGEESVIPFSCFWLAWAALWSGDFDTARFRTREAGETAPLLDDPAAEGIALTTAALLHAHEGVPERVRTDAALALRRFEELGWTVGALYALWPLGLAELCAGNPAAVDAALGALAEQITSLRAGDPMLGIFLPVEIEALIELGDIPRAGRLLTWLEQRAEAADRSWALAAAARCRGLLVAAQGDTDGAVTRLEAALCQHDRDPVPFERARTLLALGRVHRRRKEKRLAAQRLGEALSVFEALEAAGWAAQVRVEEQRLGMRTASADELTATERRVADLAAAGLANREIAQRAFLTTKAVEGNLTRVYRKLGIRSRGGLARALQHTARESTQQR